MNTIFASLRLTILLCAVPAMVNGQQTSDNYVRTVDLLDSAGVNRHVMVAYTDGIGRTVQTVEDIPEDGATVTVGKTYDTKGRLLVQTIPLSLTGNSYEKRSISNIINELSQQNAGENYPFTLYGYDVLDRNVMERGAGSGWLTHSVTKAYGGNQAQTVIRFKVTNGNLTRNGWYDSGELTKESVSDEDGNMTIVYKDFTDNIILEQRICNGNNNTYYVYDERGKLSYVLPSGAIGGLNSLGGTGPWNENTAPLARYAYIYKYDGHGRLAEKKLPGCDSQRFWYDHGGYIAFSDDGNLRQAGRRMFYFHDNNGRQVATGTCKSSTAPDVQFKDMKAVYSGSGIYGGYVSSISLDSVMMLTADYYDVYTFANGKPSLQFSADTVATHFTGGSNLHTGHCSYILGALNECEITAMYYDERARLVQSRCLSAVTGLTCDSRDYSFSGKPLRHLHTQSGVYNTEITESYAYSYHPKTDALLTVAHSVNGSQPVTLASYTYDGLGRVATKTVGGTETIIYGYNIRSWPTKIQSTKFTELMGYNTAENGMAVNYPKWDGNISALCWKHGSKGGYRGYEFDYDSMGRLTDATYHEGLDFSGSDEDYYEGYSYDGMGNIVTMTRWGRLDDNTYDYLDDLEFEYEGNRLMKVYDWTPENDPTYAGAMQFTDNADEDVEYEYDANGNMTKDLNSNITSIRYNCLNLPSQVTSYQYVTRTYPRVTVTQEYTVMSYTYNADGVKLKSVPLQFGGPAMNPFGLTGPTGAQPQGNPIPGGDGGGMPGELTLDTSTLYCGNVIFERGELSKLLTDEGYVTFTNDSTPVYHYYLRDHLGNVRVVFTGGFLGDIEQRNDYYPSGALMATSTGGSVQPYKYNGKELERTGGLDLYDYGARWMDSKIGARFTTMDPLCEKYYNVSPYAYCMDNPVMLVDPDGRVVIAKDFYAMNNIINTLSIEEANHIRFDANGLLDVNLMMSYQSTSNNYSALLTLAKSEQNFIFAVSDKDINGEPFYKEGTNVQNPNNYFYGVTNIPGAENNPSPDSNVYIFTASFLSDELQVRNTAHEGYGHAYFYELSKTDASINPFHTSENVKVEYEFDEATGMEIPTLYFRKDNEKLEQQINKVEYEAIKNFHSRY